MGDDARTKIPPLLIDCTRCGKQNHEEYASCSYCGAPLTQRARDAVLGARIAKIAVIGAVIGVLFFIALGVLIARTPVGTASSDAYPPSDASSYGDCKWREHIAAGWPLRQHAMDLSEAAELNSGNNASELANLIHFDAALADSYDACAQSEGPGRTRTIDKLQVLGLASDTIQWTEILVQEQYTDDEYDALQNERALIGPEVKDILANDVLTDAQRAYVKSGGESASVGPCAWGRADADLTTATGAAVARGDDCGLSSDKGPTPTPASGQ